MADPPVVVRMYKGLLGDCFLIRLNTPAGKQHILIDCGVLQHVPDEIPKIQRVVQSLKDTTGGKIDLLIATHQHMDHLSGFIHCAQRFFGAGKDFEIDQLWLAWTEDPEDQQAKALDAKFNKAKQAVAAFADHAAALTEKYPQANGSAPQVVYGLEAFIGPLGMAAGRPTMSTVIDMLKGAAGAIHYWEPGTVIEKPGPGLARAFVLGPPRTPKRLFTDLPSAGPGKETYLDRHFGVADQVLAAVEAKQAGSIAAECPFLPRFRISRQDITEAVPGSPLAGLRATYVDGPDWRKVDTDWLGASGALALKLDSDTNNTSLALAFELDTGRVLLFAADAQVGNWLSWHDQDYATPAGKVTASDLLSRTILYKVGHHCSHNATLKALGLELMTSPDLVAMIPVVESDAHAQGRGGWNMPFPDLLARLIEKTSGRVLRGDQDTPAAPARPFPGQVIEGPDKLFIEYAPPV